jgi:hypothetical protein
MWAEILITRDELAHALAEAFPFRVRLGDPGTDHSLSLSDLGDVRLVAGVGLRIECNARVHWPLLGLDFPVEVNDLALLLVPTVEEGKSGDRLVFRAVIERADFGGLASPFGLIGEQVVSAVNSKLAAQGAELSWDFARALTYLAPLPSLLDPLASFAIRPAWGKVRVTEEGIVYAASFHSSVVRRGDPTPVALAARTFEPPRPHRALSRARSFPLSSICRDRVVAGGLLALVVGGAYLVVRRAARARLA